MSGHDEDPLDNILNGNSEIAGDSGNTSTPDSSSGLLDTTTTNKVFVLFQNFMKSKGCTEVNTGTSSASGSSTPDNVSNTNRTDSVQQVNDGDTPQDKFTEGLEQDYKKVVQKGPPIDQRLANVFQDLAWGIFKQEKWDQVANDTIPPENIDSLEVTKVNK